jgi:hypothetical protein
MSKLSMLVRDSDANLERELSEVVLSKFRQRQAR